MEMKHFSHNHPLGLVDVQQQKKKFEDRKLICYGCLKSISSDNFAYCCPQYSCEGIFFLHKSCAELPLEISDPKHEQHSLILHQRPPYQSGSCRCDMCCRKHWRGFTYNCSLCEYNVDIKCVLRDDALLSTIMDQYLNHKSHEHPLILKPRPALFFCNVCGTEDKDQSYFCTTAGCPFWIHRSCALLPEIKESKNHTHSLALAYSFPSEYRHLSLNCDFCDKKFCLDNWVYHCRRCRYFFHVKCVDKNISKETAQVRDDHHDWSLWRQRERTRDRYEHVPPRSWLYDRGFYEEDESKEDHSIKLPGSDIFVFSNIFLGWTRDFLKDCGVEQQLPVEIKHFSHTHPLIFSIGHQHDVKELKYEETLICDGCILPISGSYYNCENCNFFLHASCAQLPKEIKHPTHFEHPLLLRKLRKSFAYQECSHCKLNSNGFLYSCAVCNFCIDLKCVILYTINVVMHEAHPHQLVNHTSNRHTRNWFGEQADRCNACDNKIYGRGFKCEDCNFSLHYRCTLLPPSITFDSFRVYKRDYHPLTLMYPPFSEHPDEFYCEICEEEIHPKNNWLYHCSECDRSFHISCLVELEKYQNIKFGVTVRVLNHTHAVKFIIRMGFTPFCECCDGDLFCQMAFECKDCNYYLCYLCAINSHDFSSDIFRSSMDTTKMIVAEESNSVFEDEAKAHCSVNLPASDTYLELARNFLRRHGIIESQSSAEINHFSHEHPLSLSINHKEDDEETLICYGCRRPISDSHYCCNECNYFLHAYCAQMPYEIQHPRHSEHSLVLSKPDPNGESRFWFSFPGGFLYLCKEKCGFHLDVHCAMILASSLMHEAHCHPLAFIDAYVGQFACSACHGDIFQKALSCEDCCFHLHYDCATLPRFAVHLKDEHPLILTLSCHSFSQHPKVIYCGFCKKKIYTIYWFYCCYECNQSFHLDCLHEDVSDQPGTSSPSSADEKPEIGRYSSSAESLTSE